MCKERGETLASPRKPVAVTQLQERVSRLGRGGGSLGMEALGGGLGGGQAWATSPHVEELRLRPLKNSEHKQGMAGIWKDHGSLKFRGC